MREKKEAWGLGCRVEEQERRGWTRDRRVVERRDKGGREKAGVIHLFEKKPKKNTSSKSISHPSNADLTVSGSIPELPSVRSRCVFGLFTVFRHRGPFFGANSVRQP
jgi:hypothetical protein